MYIRHGNYFGSTFIERKSYETAGARPTRKYFSLSGLRRYKMKSLPDKFLNGEIPMIGPLYTDPDISSLGSSAHILPGYK